MSPESPLVDSLMRLAAQSATVLRDHGDAVRHDFDGVALDQLARRYAAWLGARGIGAGDRVAVQLAPSAAHVAIVLAHLRLGVLHVPLSTKASAAEVAYVRADAGVALLVDDVPPLDDEPLAAWPAAPGADAIGLLIYTSGTTGKPKGVMLSHRALAANLGAIARAWQLGPGDLVVAMLPMHHVHGLGLAVLGALLAGAAVDLHARFEVERLLAAFADRATVFMGVPTMYVLLLAHLDAVPAAAEPLRHARLFTAGSAPLAAADLERFAAHTGHRILERYGMTETLFTLSNPYDGARRAGLVGQPVAGVEVRIVDDAGVPCGDGPGEIEVRGDSLMTGYWGQPEATAAAFRDGWFRTGDTAVRDAGSYRIVGRTSIDIIKSGGYKLGAREIEDALMASGRFAECAVLGVPDATWGEVVGAVVVLAPGAAPVEAATLLADVTPGLRALLADYKLPRRLVVADALPRNAMGKVQKVALRDVLSAAP